ncbi:hypothetical protein M1O57_01175 [Dehalococcoidia bacterium]|nr:hypothetical protein [Dehalococcoidia bacterium]MCL0037204.1 hypothetical protein [Dehalococcoidia bacterium]MCL0059118.1 hypothetical protein [Dehalococcoidia bacterium]MCL0063639.1 hypothetical protein [Dehalococcoidia bacterium]MCL0087295.1 hypothetical protein [Dehalococcoidia bacterium]
MMRIWGMLSADDEKNGFDLVLDESWYVLLLNKGEVIARFDPRDYTASELQKEVEMELRMRRGDPKGR